MGLLLFLSVVRLTLVLVQEKDINIQVPPGQGKGQSSLFGSASPMLVGITFVVGIVSRKE